MLVSLVAALALQAAPAPTGPISSSLPPAQAIERIVADCMNKGHTVEDATSAVVKCRQVDRVSLAQAFMKAMGNHMRDRRVDTEGASYLTTYNVAPRSGGSMATASVVLEIPSTRGLIVERDADRSARYTSELASIL